MMKVGLHQECQSNLRLDNLHMLFIILQIKNKNFNYSNRGNKEKAFNKIKYPYVKKTLMTM